MEEDTSFGESRKGLHEVHFFGVAVVDMLFTIFFEILLAKMSNGPFTFWLVVLLTLGEIMHAAHGVRTSTFKWLFVHRK
jgi:hypothetical protein